MGPSRTAISIKGRQTSVPSLQIGDRTIVVAGGWLKIAEVFDEPWLAGEVVTDPEADIVRVKQARLGADLFTFAQKLPNTQPKYTYPTEWENIAAIPTGNFSLWWEQRVPQETRKNVRRAGRRGVVVRDIEFDDDLLRGIVEINNETSVRQGRIFWHHGKSFEEVRRDYATMLDRSQYIGAFYKTELIGFIKMVYMGDTAGILQLLCKHAHDDKRPANALIARAVEICATKGIQYLTYGNFTYGKKSESSLTEFKRRNGFEQILVPRYYVALTATGRAALALGMHHGFTHLLPRRFLDVALKLRSVWYKRAAPV